MQIVALQRPTHLRAVDFAAVCSMEGQGDLTVVSRLINPRP